MLKIAVKLPAILFDFKASYSHVDRLSGIQYMILTIASTDSFKKLSWKEIMRKLNVPEIIYNTIYKPAIDDMIEMKMINLTEKTSFEDLVGETVLTHLGVQAYEKKVLAQDVKDFSGTVANTPASSNIKYVKESSVSICSKEGFVESRFLDIEPDEFKVENHIIKKKSEYGVYDRDVEVFDIRIEKQDNLVCYQADLPIELDEITGHFTISTDDVDENFLKARFTSADLLSKLPEHTCQSSYSDIRYEAWRDHIPEWESVTFILPCDVKFNRTKMVFVNGKNCKSDNHQCLEIADESDFVTIETSVLGYEYALVKIPVPIDGFEGEHDCKLLVRHRINTSRIAEYVHSAARAVNPHDAESLVKALNICEIINDKNFMREIMRSCLLKTSDFNGILIELHQYRESKWFSELPNVVEDVIIEKGLDAEQVAMILSRAEMHIAGTIVASKFRSHDPMVALENADVLAPVVRNEISFLRDMGLEQTMVDQILGGVHSLYSSRLLASMSNLSRNLHNLKDIFGIRSLSDYNFDVSTFDEEKKKHLRSFISTYEKDMDLIRPLIQGTDGYSELKAYESFFKEMNQYLDPGNPDWRTTGIEEGIRLAGYLESFGLKGNLDGMIAEAHRMKIINDADYRSLTEFRQFRNECAHRMNIGEVDKNKLKRWKLTIDKLSGNGIGGDRK